MIAVRIILHYFKIFNRLWGSCRKAVGSFGRSGGKELGNCRKAQGNCWKARSDVKTAYSPHVFHPIFFQSLIVSQSHTIWCNSCIYYHEFSPDFMRVLHFSTIILLQLGCVWIYLEIQTLSYARAESMWWKTQQNLRKITSHLRRTLVCYTSHTLQSYRACVNHI